MTRVYDFDGTIFRGDCTARYCAFSLRKRPLLLMKLPSVAMAFLAMAMGLISKTRAKEKLYRALLSGYDNTPGDLAEFWTANFDRLKGWYKLQASRDDIVVSASPEFLLRIPCEKLGVRLIASRVDEASGKYSGLNCHGEEKVRRYKEAGMPREFEFYSDSRSDEPMAATAVRAFFVKGERVNAWNAGEHSRRDNA